MPTDVENAGVPLDALGRSDDPRARRVAAAVALTRRDLPARQRRDIAAIEARRSALAADPRSVELRAYPAPWQKGYAEAQSQGGFTTAAATVADLATGASVNPGPALLLYGLVREFKPQRAVEMGSSVGISGSYQATALRHAGGGELLVLEGAPDLAAVAAETYAALGLDGVEVRVGPFTATLDDACRPGVDYVYVDGHHEGRATLEYFERILPHAPDALLVFDDIRWSEDMREAWRTIAHDERVAFAVNGKRLGLAFTGRPRRELRVPWRRRRARPSDLVARRVD